VARRLSAIINRGVNPKESERELGEKLKRRCSKFKVKALI